MRRSFQPTRLARLMMGALALGLLAMFGAVSTSVFAQTFGSGWSAQYFNNPTLSGAASFTTTLPNGINLNFGTGSPDPATIPVDNFSARFTSIQTFEAGLYRFDISSDDKATVYIDGALVYDRPDTGPLRTDRLDFTFTIAGAHTLQVDYFDYADQAIVQFQWAPLFVSTPGIGTPITSGGGAFPTPFGTPPIVPTAVYTGPLATVTGVRGLALRTGPYVGASFVTTLSQDMAYPVVARNNDEGIYNWYLLQVGDRRGWASGRYLTISIDRNLLPMQSSVFDEIDGAADQNVVAATRAVMNMRRRPSPRTAQVGSIPWGASASIIGRTTQAGTDRWYQVRYNGVVGWIDAAYITVRGERYAVPVR